MSLRNIRIESYIAQGVKFYLNGCNVCTWWCDQAPR